MVEKLTLQPAKNLNCQGLTLIEVIFAMSIFAIGVLAVSALAVSTVDSNSSSRRLTEATTLAEDRLERLMSLPYDLIAAGNHSEGGYNISWTISEDDIVEKSKLITVTVTRPGGLRETSVAIRHLVSKNG